MPTKFYRPVCFCCNRKQVTWKMLTIPDADGSRKVSFCSDCSLVLYNKLLAFLNTSSINRKFVFAKKAFEEKTGHSKEAIESLESLGVFTDAIKKHFTRKTL